MPTRIYVWDIGIRLFHWSLVLFVVASYLTGQLDAAPWHFYSGYVICALLVFRVIWGIVGGKYARFVHFSYSPKAAYSYLKNVITRTPSQNYKGHNPAGSLMTIALLVILAVTTFSGLKLYGLEKHKGPLAVSKLNIIASQNSPKNSTLTKLWVDKKAWEELHEGAVNVLILLILLHVLGVKLSSRHHKQNLAKAMITGYKDQQEH